MRFIRIMAAAGVIGALAAGAISGGAAVAAGGGGGGGNAMPSESAPRYDAAEEYAKAIRLIQANDFKAAARAAQHVTEAAPRNLDGWRLLGLAQSGDANWKGARRAYERAIKLAPDDLASRGGLGIALGNLKDPKAQEQLAWLKAKAGDCGAGCDPAMLRRLTAEVEKALSAEGAPAPSAALESGALIFAAAGDRAYGEAVSLINETRYDEALRVLDRARIAFGPHPDVLTYQGYAWRKKGQFERAEGYYQQALSLAPDHVGATEYYGELKVERGDMAGARAMLARLDRICTYGCAEAEELRRWIDAGGEPGR